MRLRNRSLLRKHLLTLLVIIRKELMYMLHNRRKAEIETLSTVKSRISPADGDERREGARLTCADLDDNQYAVESQDRLDFPMSDSTSPRRIAHHTSQSSPCVSSASPSVCQQPPRPSPIAPLLRYLVTKISEFVDTAQARDQTSASSCQ